MLTASFENLGATKPQRNHLQLTLAKLSSIFLLTKTTPPKALFFITFQSLNK